MPIKIQKFIAYLSVVLFLVKLLAWYLTHSVSILTDALESTVNVITGFIGLYSIILASKPRDKDHPFGHGKAEFISAALEGALIIIAGLLVIFESIDQLIEPKPLHELGYGIIITSVAGLINFIAGRYAISQGKKFKSLTIQAAGKHIQTDAYSTVAILVGLGLLYFTGWQWLDSAVALVFAAFIIVTGYKVLRQSLSGIMDEADVALLKEVIAFLQSKRQPQWIDMHNLRVIEYGDGIHIDAHMTLPWYFNVADADKEIHELENLIKEKYGNRIEIFVHIDACAAYSCQHCALHQCPVRQSVFQQLIVWDDENVWNDAKHGRPF